MIIGIDIDDTISDTYEVQINYAQEYSIEVLKREPIIRDIDYCTNHFYTKELYDWKSGEDIDFFAKYYEKIIKEVKPKTLSKKYIQKLHDEGNKIILITARWNADYCDIEEITKQWLKKNNIPYDKLIINAESKLIAAKQENVDVFIDDSFKNCQIISEAGIKTYLMDSRTNKGLKDEKIERVYSWPHVYMKLKENKRPKRT